MAVDINYINKNGDPYLLTRDINGFWQSQPNPQPTHYELSFTSLEGVDSWLKVQMDANIGDWFQIDNVRLYANDYVDDTYELTVRDFIDPAGDDNPQLYREVAVFPNDNTFVPVNEYITHTSFNAILARMGENFQFLIDKAKFLSIPPNDLSFRYGTTTAPD